VTDTDFILDVIEEYAIISPFDGAIALNGALYKNIAILKKRYKDDVIIYREHPIGCIGLFQLIQKPSYKRAFLCKEKLF